MNCSIAFQKPRLARRTKLKWCRVMMNKKKAPRPMPNKPDKGRVWDPVDMLFGAGLHVPSNRCSFPSRLPF